MKRFQLNPRCKGAILATATVSLIAMMGFMALAVDVSYIYLAQNQLQTAADAGALAGVLDLAGPDPNQAKSDARDAADQYVALNHVVGESLDLATADIIFGRTVYTSQSGWQFQAGLDPPDTIEVTVRKTAASSNGALALMFARVLGIPQTDLVATARATLVPRDIVMVLDTSRSMLFDSHLSRDRYRDINIAEVYDDLVNETGMPSTFGSLPGWTDNAGDMPFDESYKGWTYTPTVVEWDEEDEAWVPGTKPADEWAITPPFVARELMVKYNLAEWTDPDNPDMDGDNKIDTNELTNIVPWPFPTDQSQSTSRSRWENYLKWTTYQISSSWRDQQDNYYRVAGDHGSDTRKGRVGMRTFVCHLFESHYQHSSTPQLAETREQPVRAVKDAAIMLLDFLEALDSHDWVGVEHYGINAYHGYDLTEDHISLVGPVISNLQAGHITPWTNIGDGIRLGKEKALENGRDHAAKVLLVLTDGNANHCDKGWGDQFYADSGDYTYRDRNTSSSQNGHWYNGVRYFYSTYTSKEYALEMARQAADENMRICTISLGSQADSSLMQEIADIGHGTHYYVDTFDIEQCEQELQDVFRSFGSKRVARLTH